MSSSLVWISLLYLGFMFFIAYWAEKKQNSFKRSFSSGWMYALSLAVYCSAWTFYGSIGRASDSGLDYLAIYIGPTLMMPLWWIITRKVVKITKDHHISSLADFMASRYGKDQKMGTIVALLALLAVTPYIALQLKAIAESFKIASGDSHSGLNLELLASAILCLFTLFYGTRYVAANKPKRGMVTVVAIESAVKLLTFLVGGVALIYFYYSTSASELFTRANAEGLSKVFAFTSENSYTDWTALVLVSALALLLLPRQFQVGVVENTSERQLKKAMWVFPGYLLLINIFVIPLALAGIFFLGEGANSDYYFLGLSHQVGADWLTLLIYVGGFSAATSMIIVSSIALGSMLSTNVIVPVLLKNEASGDFSKKILNVRRLSIVVIFILAYLYYRWLALETPLVSIGITSFIGVAQLAPAFLGGVFWKEATKKGALAGIIGGFVIWFYALILPSILSAFGAPGVLENTIFNPSNFGGLGMNPVTSVIIFSLLVNAVLFVGVSIFTQPNQAEENQAKVFVDALEITRTEYNNTSIWQGTVPFPDIKSLLIKFLGDRRTEEVLDRYARINGISFTKDHNADSKVIAYAERLLTEAIGPASARIMIKSVVKEAEISIVEVIDILKESKEVLQLNKDLRQKSQELKLASQELKIANEQLTKYSELKDEFLYTVTHELRTPLTSIRTQAEILTMDDEMPDEDKQMFLDNIVKDCERLTKLITHVLDLERFESGNQKLSLAKSNINEVINDSVRSLEQLSVSNQVNIQKALEEVPMTFFDKERLAQVLVNLISNAIKFADSKKGEIIVSSHQEGDFLRVDVQDNGQGMNKDDLDLVFDKFYQVKNQTRKKPSGSGLGLAICKNIIQMHKGQIWVDHSDETGTRLSFTLPLYGNIEHKNIAVYEEDTHS